MRQPETDSSSDLGTNTDRTPEPSGCDHYWVYPFARPPSGQCWHCGMPFTEYRDAMRSQPIAEDPRDERGESDSREMCNMCQQNEAEHFTVEYCQLCATCYAGVS